MKILLSAFACKPNSGSETGVGWRWATELAKQYEVVVITDVSRKSDIEAELLVRPVKNLSFTYYRPSILKKTELNSRTAQLLYIAWQFGVVWYARKLHRQFKFDLVHHLTYGVFRHPSFLGLVGPPFVFGPVGGGEMAPWALTRSMPFSEKSREYGRFAVNLFAKIDPFLWLALSRTKLILAKTPETTQALPFMFRRRSETQLEIGIDPRELKLAETKKRSPEQAFRVLFAGRLLGLKGIHLALRAVASAIQSGRIVHFVIVGDGPMRSHLADLAMSLKIENYIEWIGHIPQKDLFTLYESVDCLLFPSLHDSSGNVVLEAMSFGVPVICLDLGGPAVIVDPSCGIIVNTSGKNERSVVDGLHLALNTLIDSPEICERLSMRAREKSAAMTWSSQIDSAMTLIKKRIGWNGQ
jgi:glycosyltransferase involved in cell wall biosynthesis